MGLRRPLRRLVPAVIAIAAALVLGFGGEAGSQPQPAPAPLLGFVPALGASGEGWQLEHPAPGVYRLSVPGEVDVDEWDGPAQVTILPLGSGRTEIRFDVGGIPTDTAFWFSATR